METGTYKFKQPNQYTKWHQRMRARIVRAILKFFQWVKLGVVVGLAMMIAYFVGISHGTTSVIKADSLNTVESKIELLQNELIDEIARKENINNIPIVIDDNKAGTLPKKDKVSIGCMQFKIGTIQHYYSYLKKGEITDKEAIMLALDCDKAKELANEIIFKTQGGLWNWSVATKEMGIKVGIIKEMMK